MTGPALAAHQRHLADRVRGVVSSWGTATFALACSVVAGFVFARLGAPTVHNRYFPWIAGRTLGLAAYVALWVMVVLGIWLRHPLRHRWPLIHPETRLRAHAALGAATVVLVAGHLVSLAADKYAGVGWKGALLPGFSHYRTVPVALGVVSLYAILAISATAGLAGRMIGRGWLPVHQIATFTFAAVWFHGVLSGTDTPAFRAGYTVTGAAVAVLAATRYALRERARSGATTARAGEPAGPAVAATTCDPPTAPALLGDELAAR